MEGKSCSQLPFCNSYRLSMLTRNTEEEQCPGGAVELANKCRHTKRYATADGLGFRSHELVWNQLNFSLLRMGVRSR